MARVGPVVLQTVGQQYASNCRILLIMWDGNGAALIDDDRVVLRALGTNDLLFQATYPAAVGANFGPNGIHAPKGFSLELISRGILMVYLREEL